MKYTIKTLSSGISRESDNRKDSFDNSQRTFGTNLVRIFTSNVFIIFLAGVCDYLVYNESNIKDTDFGEGKQVNCLFCFMKYAFLGKISKDAQEVSQYRYQ